MNKRRFYQIIILSGLIAFPAQSVSAQDTGSNEDKEGIELLIDEALERAEDTIELIENDPLLDDTVAGLPQAAAGENEIEISEGSKPDTGQELAQDVEVLEDVVIKEEVVVEDLLETKVIPLLHAEASTILETLEQMKGPEGIISYNGEDRTLIIKDAPKQLEAMNSYVKKVDILLETEIYQLEHIDAEDCIEAVRAVLTENVGQAQVDKSQNSIVATDTPLKIGEINELIEKLDFVDMEIQIESKILQIILNDEHIAGVDWEAIVSEYQKVPFPGFTRVTDSPGTDVLNLGAVTQDDYTILLEALDTVGVVKELSNGVFNTDNDITKTVSVSSDGSALLTEETVHFSLTPTVNRDELLTVTVDPQLIGKHSGEVNFNLEENIKIQIENGSTIVIGSLFNEVMVESSWKIPLLGDLPILGFVFRNQGQVSRKAEIITFLTVKTVPADLIGADQ